MNFIINNKQPVTSITVANAKDQLVILHDREDSYIELVLNSAIDLAESYTRRKFSTTNVSVKLTGSSYFEPPFSPNVKDITAKDQDDNALTVNYDEFSNVITIEDAYDEHAIVTYNCGYDADLPDSAKMGVLKLVSTLYEFREDVATVAINNIPLSALKVLNRVKDSKL